jgi:hypothetical protein
VVGSPDQTLQLPEIGHQQKRCYTCHQRLTIRISTKRLLTQKLRYEVVVVLADLPPSYVSLSYHYQRNTATKDVGHSDHRHAMPERTDSLQIYSAISCEATTVSRQNQVIGTSAPLLRQRPIDRASRLETFMTARLRTSQVGRSDLLCVRLYSLLTRKQARVRFVQSQPISSRVRSSCVPLTLAGAGFHA